MPTTSPSSPSSPHSLDIIIAHYNEDLSWIEEARALCETARFFIYTKGIHSSTSALYPFAIVVPLPNVGRESHTYLHHIITHYDDLAEHVLFTQGNPFDHKPREEFFEAFIKGTCTHANARDWYPIPDKANVTYTWTPQIENVAKHPNRFIGIWWDFIFDKKEQYENALKVVWGGIFRVHKSYITRRPHLFYRRAIATVSYDANPIEGHYFERAWGNLLQCPY